MAETRQPERAFRIAREAEDPEPPWMSSSPRPPDTYQSTTQRCIDVYLLSQRPNGSMGGIGWWQCANGYTAIALHDLWADASKHNYAALDAAIRKCEARQRGLVNVFNDDTLWWALLCIHMYGINGDAWYLRVAQGIWQHIGVCGRGQVFFRGHDMEGAVYWTTKPHEEQLSAISTALFAELSARLALLRQQQPSPSSPSEPSTKDYIAAARYSLAWILRHRFRPREGVVLDHIKLRQDKCIDWTFTYTTGVTLGASALLYAATGDEDYMHLACHMACRAMTHKGWVERDSGVLTEKGAYGRGRQDPWKDNDSVGFKAVLVRELGVLYDVVLRTGCRLPKARETAEMVRAFVNVNFKAQVEQNSNDRGQYGPWWDGPFECPTSHSQMAVLDVMAAVRLMDHS